MPLKTIIIDDEPIALEKLKSYVSKIPELELTAACGSAFEAVAVISREDVDLIITDFSR